MSLHEIDSLEGARMLSEPFAAAGRRLDVLLKIDCGYHRVGVLPENALAVTERLADLPGVRLRGLFTHAGHVYAAGSPEDVAEIGRQEGETLASTAVALERAGISIEEVSVGSTPSARHAMRVAGVTECRPGNYVFHDGSQVALGTCAPEDCAMTVLATVVSVPASDRAVVDAGSKTLSQDSLRPRPNGHGLILEHPEARIARFAEEHGFLDLARSNTRPSVGDVVRIVPNHVCVVVNMMDEVLMVRGEEIVGTLPVAARGKLR